MATNDTNDLSHLSMLYPDLVDEAMRSDEPVTQKDQSGDTRLIYRAVNYDPENETAYMCYLQADTHPDYNTTPSVHFMECSPTADFDTLQEWTAKATGRLNGPQDFDTWLEYFAVFQAAAEHMENDLTE